MSEQDVELVAQILEAFNSEDIELILTFTHADFEVDVPAEFSTEPDVYRGHDGMRRYWDSFQDAMYAIRIRPERLWDAGGAVVAAMHLTARGKAHLDHRRAAHGRRLDDSRRPGGPHSHLRLGRGGPAGRGLEGWRTRFPTPAPHRQARRLTIRRYARSPDRGVHELLAPGYAGA